VRETTPGGDVIMSYNKSSEAFVYYTDNLTDISYEILETVAQKFAIEYNCKALCVERKTVQIQKQIDDNLKRRLAQAEQAQAQAEQLQAQAEQTQAEQLQLQAQAEQAQAEQAQAEEKPKERSLFATFKTYNTATKGGTPNFNNGLESVNEQITNHFRFRGKTKEYEENEKARIAAQEAAKLPVMDYNSFKQMMKENKTC
jgi:multidrug efflux pump subunit AcrA (membrane-fusion protein)